MLFIALLVSFVHATGAAQEVRVEHPFPGVAYTRLVRDEPVRQVFHIVTIAPDAPGLAFKTTGSNGEAPRDTDTETALAFARRTGTQVAINANFFSPVGEPHADLLGLAVSNGTVVSPWDSRAMTEAIHFGPDNRIDFLRPASIGRPRGTETNPPVTLYNAVSGNLRVVDGGRIPIPEGGDRHPRTLIGTTADGVLLLVVADGRRRGVSEGATMRECAEVLLEHGAATAINLDGGGSSALVIANPGPRVVNRPSGPFGQLRRNGNHLGVFVGEISPESHPRASGVEHTRTGSPAAPR